MELNFEIKEAQNSLLILLKGDLDAYTCNSLKEKVKEMLKDRIVDIYIDAKELNYIDSTGLGTIIGIYKILKENDKQIYMENLKPNVRKMFKITDLDQIISIKE